MMREDDSFDELIREKLNQRAIKPSDQRRSKAKQAIDSRNMLKRFRMGINIGITIVAASGIIFLGNYLFHKNNAAENSPSEIVKTNNQTVLNSQKLSTTPSQDQSLDSNQNDSQQTIGTNANSNAKNAVSNSVSGNQVIANDNHSSSNDHSQNSNSSAQHSKNDFANNFQQNNSNHQNKNSNNHNSSSATAVSKSKNQNDANDGQVVGSNNSQNKNPSATSANGVQNTNDGNSQTLNSNNGMNSSSAASTGIQNTNDGNSQMSNSNKGLNSSSAGIQNANDENLQTLNSSNEQIGNKINSSSTATAQKDSTENQIAKNNLAPSSANTTKSNPVVSSQISDSNKTKSQVAATSSDSTGIIPADQNQNGKRHGGNVNYFFAEAGFTFIPGFAAGFHSGRSLNPVVGGGWCFRVGLKSSMEMGLHYTFIGHASDSSIIYTNTTYAFGSQNQYTEVGLKRLHYAALPVSFTYHLNGKHAITAGVTANYLFTTETRWRTYSQIDSNIHSISKFGYGQGINRFDALLMLGYTRTLNQAWSMRLSGYCGLMDVKNNSWYGVNKFERNKGIQFTIQYAF